MVKFAPDQRNTCPRGWFQFNSRCFMFVKTSRTWPNAEAHCHTLAQTWHLCTAMKSPDSTGGGVDRDGSFPLTWIGGFDAVQAKVEKDRLWFWSDGSKFDHESWAEGEPNNHNGAREPCIQINFGAENDWKMNHVEELSLRVLHKNLFNPSNYRLKPKMLLWCQHPNCKCFML
nr:ladderlectin-like [Salvelinus alpinus]